MKKRELLKLGFSTGAILKAAMVACGDAADKGIAKGALRDTMRDLAREPERFVADPIFGPVAALMVPRAPVQESYNIREEVAYPHWGEDIDAEAHRQMRNACSLPISVAGALMPDAHVGYGLPIGGVLATHNAVIPYAVGVDIACRVKMTVFDLTPTALQADLTRFKNILSRETLFGVGAKYRRPLDHPVMDENWNFSPVIRQVKDLAWQQLGTSGSGNHFVEFGEAEFGPDQRLLPPGRYVAVVSHSGSRGAGNRTASYYSKLARDLHANLPKHLHHLAWLALDAEGAEYWAAMELMGRYAHANHELIHARIIRALGETVVFQIENHHNFAWKEKHDGREVIVHRKGATPAGRGVLGYIPGSMTAPGYLVEGLGNPRSLDSASHGAGRRMSRKAAKEMTTWHDMNAYLREKGVTLLSAGLDETPHAYKDIEQVMDAQADLVKRIAKFSPRIVRMAPEGEKPED